MEPISRRQVILACVGGGMAALAGCGGGQGGSPGGTDDGEGSGGDTNNGGSGGSGSGGSGGGDDPVTDSSDSDGGEAATDSDGDSGASGGDMPALGDAAEFPDSFAMTATVTTEGQTVELSGRYYQGDIYWELEQQGQRIEWYLVGDSSYFVTGGQCFSGSIQQGISRDDVDPGRFPEEATANPGVSPAGRDTVDGDEVLVYEVTATGAGGSGETLTYYVLPDSGYLRRIESESMQWDFTSWGNVDPVEEPEQDCQSLPGGTPAPPDSGG